MKIAYLTQDLNPRAGWGRYSSDLIFGVKKASHEVLILKEQDDSFEGIPILKRGIEIFGTAGRIRKYLKDCDLIHALDGYPYGIIAALAKLGLKKKLVITSVGTYSVLPLYNFSLSCLLKWAYRRADKVIAISNYTKNEILKKIKIEIGVINPGINFDKFYQKHEDIKENFILSVGIFKYRKGYHLAIPAFALARKKINDLKYIIVGSQDDLNHLEYLKNLARKYYVDKYIRFLTNISDKELLKLYSQAKLFILPSINVGHNFEGFGLVFLEAAAAGLPVIGTRGNGIEDSVQNNFNGILVEQNNIKQIAEAIIKILDGQKLWHQMSANSYIWARKHDLSFSARDYISIYKQLLNQNR